GDVHHVSAAAAPHHGRKEEVAAVDHAPEVDREDPPPVLERSVEKAAAQPHAGIVDQDVDGLVLGVDRVGDGVREGERGRAPDAARRAGDERRLPVEPHGTPPRKSSTARLKISGVSKLKPWLPPGTLTSFAPGMLRARTSELAGEMRRSASPV